MKIESFKIVKRGLEFSTSYYSRRVQGFFSSCIYLKYFARYVKQQSMIIYTVDQNLIPLGEFRVEL